MSYLTVHAYEACGFNGYAHAGAWEVMGFRAVDLPNRIASQSVGLRNANGDYIKDILAWIAHDKRVAVEHRKLVTSASCQIDRFPDLLA